MRRGRRWRRLASRAPLRDPEIRPKQWPILCTSSFLLFNYSFLLFIQSNSVFRNYRWSFNGEKRSNGRRRASDSWDGWAPDVIFPNIWMSHSLRKMGATLDKHLPTQPPCNTLHRELKAFLPWPKTLELRHFAFETNLSLHSSPPETTASLTPLWPSSQDSLGIPTEDFAEPFPLTYLARRFREELLLRGSILCLRFAPHVRTRRHALRPGAWPRGTTLFQHLAQIPIL